MSKLSCSVCGAPGAKKFRNVTNPTAIGARTVDLCSEHAKQSGFCDECGGYFWDAGEYLALQRWGKCYVCRELEDWLWNTEA